MKAVVAASMIGPHGLAEHLFAEHARATLAEPPRTTDFLDAATALADGVAADLDARGLSAVVAAWRELDREALARNLRLRALWGELPSERDPARAAEVVGRVQEVEADIAAGHGLVVPIYLRGRQGMALKTLGRFDEAIAAWRDGATLAESVRWPNRKVVFLRAIGTVEVRRDRHAAAVAPYTEALELLESFGSSASAKTLADTRTELAVCLVESGRSADALPVAEQALREQTALGNHAGMARVLLKLGAIRRAFLQMDQALELLERGTAEYEAAGNGGGAAYGRSLTATVLFDLSQFDRAGTVLRRGDEAEALGLEGVALDAALGLGKVLREQGRFEEAQALHRGVIERSGAGRNILAPRAWKELARDLTAAGDHDGALEAARARGRAVQESLGGTKSLLRVSYRELAEAYLTVGRPRKAIGAARKSVAGGGSGCAATARKSALATSRAACGRPTSARSRLWTSRGRRERRGRGSGRGVPLRRVLAGRAPRGRPPGRARAAGEPPGGEARARPGRDDPQAGVAARASAATRGRTWWPTRSGRTGRPRGDCGTCSAVRTSSDGRTRPGRPRSPSPWRRRKPRCPEGTLLVVYHQSATRAFAVALGRDRTPADRPGRPAPLRRRPKAWSEALTLAGRRRGRARRDALRGAPRTARAAAARGRHAARRPGRGASPSCRSRRWCAAATASGGARSSAGRSPTCPRPRCTPLIERERAARPPGDALVALGDPVYPTEGLPRDRIAGSRTCAGSRTSSACPPAARRSARWRRSSRATAGRCSCAQRPRARG